MLTVNKLTNEIMLDGEKTGLTVVQYSNETDVRDRNYNLVHLPQRVYNIPSAAFEEDIRSYLNAI